MSNHEDLIRLIAVFVTLLVAFPAIGAALLESVLLGFFVGVVAAIVLGVILLLISMHNRD